MGALQLVSTESVRPSERIVLFKDSLQTFLGRLEIQTLPRTPFRAELRFAKLDGASLCWLRADGHQVERIGGRHGEDLLHISFQIKQTVRFSYEWGTMILPPGQWVLNDSGKPGSVFAPEGTETLVLLLPREKLPAGTTTSINCSCGRFQEPLVSASLPCNLATRYSPSSRSWMPAPYPT